jgi:hypothetical protein
VFVFIGLTSYPVTFLCAKNVPKVKSQKPKVKSQKSEVGSQKLDFCRVVILGAQPGFFC